METQEPRPPRPRRQMRDSIPLHQDCHRCVVHRKCLWTLRSGKEGGDSTWQAVTYCQAYSVTVIPSLRA